MVWASACELRLWVSPVLLEGCAPLVGSSAFPVLGRRACVGRLVCDALRCFAGLVLHFRAARPLTQLHKMCATSVATTFAPQEFLAGLTAAQ